MNMEAILCGLTCKDSILMEDYQKELKKDEDQKHLSTLNSPSRNEDYFSQNIPTDPGGESGNQPYFATPRSSNTPSFEAPVSNDQAEEPDILKLAFEASGLESFCPTMSSETPSSPFTPAPPTTPVTPVQTVLPVPAVSIIGENSERKPVRVVRVQSSLKNSSITPSTDSPNTPSSTRVIRLYKPSNINASQHKGIPVKVQTTSGVSTLNSPNSQVLHITASQLLKSKQLQTTNPTPIIQSVTGKPASVIVTTQSQGASPLYKNIAIMRRGVTPTVVQSSQSDTLTHVQSQPQIQTTTLAKTQPTMESFSVSVSSKPMVTQSQLITKVQNLDANTSRVSVKSISSVPNSRFGHIHHSASSPALVAGDNSSSDAGWMLPSEAEAATVMNSAAVSRLQSNLDSRSIHSSNLPHRAIDKQQYANERALEQKVFANGRDPNMNKMPPEHLRMRQPIFAPQMEDYDDDNDDLAQAETYAEYSPRRWKLGNKHPDPIVESSSLSSVMPPTIHYNLALPDDIIHEGKLSNLQLESVVYACQRHDCILANGCRAGFLIGDGAGVGKGRTIAGIIFENYLRGRKKAIWMSVSNDLKIDAERDLRDVGASKIKVHALNKLKYAKIKGRANGKIKRGVIFSTYSSLIGESTSAAKAKYKSRIKQLVHWCGKDFDGVIVFDECHRAKNLTPSGSQRPTKTGLTVLDLQNRLPLARVVYASATGATEPRNMAYMTRLGLWGEGTPFRQFSDFINTVERRGVGAMELVAMDMKLRGMYIARQLSFHGVTFRIREVPIEDVRVSDQSFMDIYNESVEVWTEAYYMFDEASSLLDPTMKFRKSMWGQFWSAHQRFFKYLCIAAKVNAAVRIAKESINNNKCVVIGLQSTGEARTMEQVDELNGELTDFISTAKGVFVNLVEKHFPSPDQGSSNEKPSGSGRGRGGSNANKEMGLRDIFNEDELKNLLEGKDATFWTEQTGSNRTPREAPKSARTTEGGDALSSDDDSSDDDSSDFALGSDADDLLSGRKRKRKAKKSDKKAKRKRRRSRLSSSSDSSIMEDNEDEYLEKAMRDACLALPPVSSVNDDYSRDRLDGGIAAGHRLTPWRREVKHEPYGSQAPIFNSETAKQRAREMKSSLMKKIEEVGDRLPSNSLDELIDKLGGPNNVAEMTGRKGRVVANCDGRISYESRRETDVSLEVLNLTEKQRFMDGEKLIAIISEAASSGISLQADRRVKNQRRRVHITLELPWSADRAVQQFGRTHRSNQVSAPEYIFLISNLAGEQRFASTVAKRLESLGALTHGDRRANETQDLSRFNIDNKAGKEALDITLRSIVMQDEGIIPIPEDYPGDFVRDVGYGLRGVGMATLTPSGLQLEKESGQVSKFLNRILGMKVQVQNYLFRYFTDTLDEILRRAKRDGKIDLGILDLGVGGQNVEIVDTRSFETRFLTDSAQVHLHKVRTQRGLSWEKALDIFYQHTGKNDGFYVSKAVRNDKPIPILAVRISSRHRVGRVGQKDKLYRIYRPNTGMQGKLEELSKIKDKYTKVPEPLQCFKIWDGMFKASETQCIHMYWFNHCSRRSERGLCEVGLRTRTYYVLSGSVLNVWSRVEAALSNRKPNQTTMQIVRLHTQGQRIIGSLIPSECVSDVTRCLMHQTEDFHPQSSQASMNSCY